MVRNRELGEHVAVEQTAQLFHLIGRRVEPGRLEAPGSRNQAELDVIRVTVGLTGASELTVGMKADVYFRADKIASP